MRNATLDHARLWAAFGIVLFHAGAPGSTIGYAGLPFFLMLMMVLGLPGAGRSPFGVYAAGRAGRLLAPWLIWSGVYGLLKLAEVLVTGRPFASEFAPHMLLSGPAIHLWFLPFAFAASLMLPLVARIMPAGTAGRRGLIVLFCLAGFAALGADQGPVPGLPLAQWRHALPAVLLGTGFALAGASGSGDRRAGLVLAALTSSALGLCAVALGWTDGLVQLALATSALLACVLVPRPETGLSRLAARCSLGVYLAHPLVMSVLERTTPLPAASLALALATAAGALCLTWGLAALADGIHSRRTVRNATATAN